MLQWLSRRANPLERQEAQLFNQQDIATINADGRMKWKVATGYGKPSLAETAIGRYKSIIGGRLWARLFAAQQTEAALGCDVLNQMLACARPKSVRVRQINA